MSRAMELSVVARCRGSFLGPVQAGLRPASGDQPYPSMMSLRLRVFPRLETFSAKLGLPGQTGVSCSPWCQGGFHDHVGPDGLCSLACKAADRWAGARGHSLFPDSHKTPKCCLVIPGREKSMTLSLTRASR